MRPKLLSRILREHSGAKSSEAMRNYITMF